MTVLLAASAAGQERPKLFGEVEFFGYTGVDVSKLRASLPFHEQDRFVEETFVAQLDQTGEAVRQATGHWPTDLANVCCDERGNRIIFIGLAGEPARYNPPPRGHARLPENILGLYDQAFKLKMERVEQGTADEDDSKGYYMSSYPPLRSILLKFRAYALRHEALVREVVETSADERQRIAAAELLGYARQSQSQLAALVRASQDSNSGVRNNATRALVVLANSNPKVAGEIPVDSFIEMLLSDKWSDLNKASALLNLITKSRNEETLARLRRREVLDRLIEMARWRSGHAEPARYILGRIAGIDESRLRQLVANKQVEVIIAAQRVG